MVLINMDTVYELTILLCGLHRERKKEREGVDGTNRECMQKLTAKHEKGSFGEKRKYSRAEGRVGGEVLVGVAENRRRKDGGERRGGDWIKCLN